MQLSQSLQISLPALLLTNICVWALPTVCVPLCLHYRVCATEFLGRFICIYGSVALPIVRLSGFLLSQGYTPSLSPDRTCSHRSGSAWPHTSSESICIIWETLRGLFKRAVNDIKTCLWSSFLLILPDLYVNRKLSRCLFAFAEEKRLHTINLVVNTSQKRIMLICATEKELLMTNMWKRSRRGVDGWVCAIGSAVIFLELLLKDLCVRAC